MLRGKRDREMDGDGDLAIEERETGCCCCCDTLLPEKTGTEEDDEEESREKEGCVCAIAAILTRSGAPVYDRDYKDDIR